MSEIAAAVEALVRWSRTEDGAALPESALGLLDIAATGLADLGVTLPSPVDGPSGTWMGAYFAAVAKAARLEVIASDSARTRAMTHLARTEGVYHASALERIVGGGPDRAAAAWSGPARSAMRVTLCEFVAHLAQGFALHGRTPHCGPAGRSLLQGAIDFA